MQKSLIYETDHIAVISQPASSPVFFVTFNELFLQAGGLEFWGDGLLAQLGVGSVGVVSKRPNWYPLKDMEVACGLIAQIGGGRRLITYGHSQGGYGALKYAGRLEAALSLAFCPQWSINPADVGAFDERYTMYFDQRLDNGLRIEADDVGPQNYVLFDKYYPTDARNVEKIGALPGVRLIHAPFSEHNTISLIAQSGNGANLVRLFLEEKPDYSDDLRRILRASRRSSKTYRENRTLYLVKKGWATRKDIDDPGFSEEARWRMKMEMALRERYVEAVEGLVAEATEDNLNTFPLYKLWSFCRETDLSLTELHLAHMISALRMKDVFTRLLAVNSFIKLGFHPKARSELQLIVKQFGLDQQTSYIKAFASNLGMDELVKRVVAREMANPDLSDNERWKLQIEQAMKEDEAGRVSTLIAGATNEQLRLCPPYDLWHFCRRHNRKGLELRIAQQIADERGDNVIVRLLPVNSFTKFGMAEKARATLNCVLDDLGKEKVEPLLQRFAAELGLTAPVDNGA